LYQYINIHFPLTKQLPPTPTPTAPLKKKKRKKRIKSEKSVVVAAAAAVVVDAAAVVVAAAAVVVVVVVAAAAAAAAVCSRVFGVARALDTRVSVASIATVLQQATRSGT
jgi:hypothetical protein